VRIGRWTVSHELIANHEALRLSGLERRSRVKAESTGVKLEVSLGQSCVEVNVINTSNFETFVSGLGETASNEEQRATNDFSHSVSESCRNLDYLPKTFSVPTKKLLTAENAEN
jgi:hypothetical protein